ncbi:MAG: DUF547 domain-containing protein [Rhodospirillales bacterium]|nr:DUF547 domain-containing protein [Rhodospirillales bacterium]
MRIRRVFLVRFFVLAFALTVGGPFAAAAPKADLWPRWQTHDPASAAMIDHAAWGGFLKSYVVKSADGVNRVAYGRVTPADRAALDAYIARLAALPIDGFNRDEQRAYWINLYNALTVRVVLDRYPVATIRDIRISPGLFAIGPWGKKLVAVAGEKLSLDDIEHRILRPIWKDPRLHYAVNCAALGCPNLVREAYTAANTERLLDDGARAYVNHPRGAQFTGERLKVSSIYVWFQEDFGNNDAGVIAHLRRYAGPGLAARLAATGRIADDDYDWKLNDAADAD